MKLKSRDLLLSLLAMVAWQIPTISLAAQEYNYLAGEKIRAKISDHSTNRIKFGVLPVMQIVGDGQKYQLVTDQTANNIFLVPKIATGERLELSLINAAGMVVDLELITSDIEGQFINITSDSLESKDKSLRLEQAAEIAAMIKAMIRDTEDKYYVTMVKRKMVSLPGLPSLVITQDRIYRFGALTGARLVVKNYGHKPLELSENELSSLFEGVVATSSERNMLGKQEKAYVWIITKEQRR